MIRTGILLLAAAMLMIPIAQTNAATDPQAAAATIAPLLDEQTFAVIRIDVAKVKIDAMLQWVHREFQLPVEMAREPAEAFAKWQQAFLATGASEIYIVLSMADLPNSSPPIVVPIGKGVRAAAVIAALRTPIDNREAKGPGPFGDRRGNVVQHGAFVIGVDKKRTLERLQTLTPSPRPDLAAAFAAAGDAAVAMVLIPSDVQRRIISETLPPLPPPAIPISGAVLVRGIRWAALGVTLPPNASVSLTIQSLEPADAKALQEAILSVMKLVAAQDEVKRVLPEIEQLIIALTPKLRQNQLVLQLNAEQTNQLIKATILPALERAQQIGRQVLSANRLKMIYMAIVYYESDHHGQTPANLQVLAQEGMIKANMLSSPIGGAAGYIYIRPPTMNRLAHAPTTIVAYEDPAKHGGQEVNVIFADGHVELLKVDDRLSELIRQSAEQSAAAYENKSE